MALQSVMPDNSGMIPGSFQQSVSNTYDLISGEHFYVDPEQRLPGLYISVEEEDSKMAPILGEASTIFINPMILYGFEVLPKGL